MSVVSDELLTIYHRQTSDFIITSRSYEDLKEAARTRTAPTEDRCIRQLLLGAELGNRKLSELLREMRPLRDAPFGDDSLLRNLLLQKLRPHLSLCCP